MNLKQLKIKSEFTVKSMGMAICLGTFVSAYNSVCVSQLATLLQLKNSLSTSQTIYQLSVATSVFNLGKIIGPLFFKKFRQLFGFLNGLLILDLLSIIFILLSVISLEFYTLTICRFMLGLLVGLSTAITPVYLRQISPVQISGKIGSYNQVLQVVGVFVCYCVGFIVDDEDKSDEWRWRVFLGLSALALVIRSLALQLFFPFDSLDRYVTQKNHKKIREYCRIIYENEEEASQRIIQQYSQTSQSKNNGKGERVFGKLSWKKRLIIAIVLIASNQLTGINGIMYYTKQLFNKVTNNNANLTQILMVLLAFLQIISASLSGNFIDRIGRKKILLNGMLILIFILMSIFFLKLQLVLTFMHPKNVQLLVVILIFSHIFVHNMSLSPVCIVYCAEIVEDITWVIITLKMCSFSVALSADYMIEYLGFGNMFFVFGVLSIVVYLFLRDKMEETKGLSRKQIYSMFEEKVKRQ